MSLWKFFDTKKFNCMVQVNTGFVMGYEKSPRLSRRVVETHINHKVNDFPYTDEDFIIMAARKVVME